MNTAETERLGFSDLTDDEGFLIVLFRDWQRRGPTRAVAEHSIARLLQHDKLYAALAKVFSVFDDLDRGAVVGADPGLMLTEVEEAVLTRLASVFAEDLPPCDVAGGMRVRPAEKIARSGHDRISGAQDRGYWRAAAYRAVPRGQLH